MENEGFEKSKDPKTIRFCKADFGQISLEPGSQLEFASKACQHMIDLHKNLNRFFDLFDRFIQQSGFDEVVLLRKGYYTAGEPIEAIPILQNKRYSIMNAYFKQFGDFADNMMKCTCALQIHFDFSSVSDLVEKVNRMLLAKPILLYLSSNSSSNDDKLYSFRETIWENGDPSRTGTPANDEIFSKGTWSLQSYLLKILNAPPIFEPKKEHGDDFYKILDHHISTIFTDIRVRNTIELRYLDCPSQDMLLPLIQFTHGLIYNDDLWQKFENLLPYSFEEIPFFTKQINHGTDYANQLWHSVIATPLTDLLKWYEAEEEVDFSALRRKVLDYRMIGSEVLELSV